MPRCQTATDGFFNKPRNVKRIYGGGFISPLPVQYVQGALEDPMASAKRYIYNIPKQLDRSKMPSRASARVECWKAKLQRKRRIPSSLEWDSTTSTPRHSSSKESSTHSSCDQPGCNYAIGQAMLPPMFAQTESKQLMNLLLNETVADVKMFKPIEVSSMMPDKFPRYKLHRKVPGSYAYIPPDTRQAALNTWFERRAKKPAPSIDKVHIGFGRITYPYLRSKTAPLQPEPNLKSRKQS